MIFGRVHTCFIIESPEPPSTAAASWLSRRIAPRIRHFARYAVGSALATVVSAVTIAVVYRGLGAGPRIATIVAFVAGAIVNFTVFRFWAWRGTRNPIGRDLARFSVVAVGTAVIALGTTTLADAYATDAGLDATARTLLVEGSYFGAFAVMFVAKFVILDRFVFNDRRRASDLDTSRDQVENTTRG